MAFIAAVVTGLFLLTWSFMYAMLEIAIKGPVGWALAAPTWRKKSKIYSALMGGKELTGYHLWMFFLPLILLHGVFVFAAYWGLNFWTLGRELELLACYFVLCAHWDFAWFVMNPAFGLRRFRRGEIWWHEHWIWRIPTDYFSAVSLALGLVTVAQFVGEGSVIWLRFGTVLAVLFAGLAGIIFFEQEIQRWHLRMSAAYRIAEGWGPEGEALRDELLLIEGSRLRIADLGRRRAQRDQLGPKTS